MNKGKKGKGREKSKLREVPDMVERLRVESISLLIINNLSYSHKDEANPKVS